MPKKRVLRIIARLNVGGPAKHVHWVCSGLKAKGYENLLVYGGVEENEDDFSAAVKKSPIRLLKMSAMARSISPLKDLHSLFSLYKIIRRFQPRICHTHTSKAGFLGRIAVFLYNLFHPFQTPISVLHTFHGHTFHGYFSPWKHRLFLWIEKILAKCTDVIIVISNQQKHEICDSYGVGTPDQFRIIPLGIDTAFAKDLDPDYLKERLSIPKDAFVFGIVGRISPVKNHTLFLNAVSQFQQDFPDSNTHFLIIGGGAHAEMQRLRQQVQELKLRFVKFAGNIEEPEHIYGAIDALVLTSKNEGTPVAILESFASKKPVIASAVGGVIDLLGVDSRRGFLLQNPEPSNFSSSFQKVMLHQPLEILTEAKDYVEKSHSIERLTSDLDELYRSLSVNWQY